MVSQSRILTCTLNWQVNTPYKYVGLAIMLTLFFSSCEEPLETDSIKLVPSDNNTEIRSIEIPVDYTQAAFDSSVISSNNINATLQQIFFGKNEDPDIGNTTLQAFAGLQLPSNFPRDSVNGATVVDINFVMRFGNVYGDNLLDGQDIVIHQLQDALSLNAEGFFKLDDSFEINPARISEVNNTYVNPIIHNTDSPDSISAVNVPLTDSFGQFILNGIMNTNLKTEDFSNYLKGVRISTDGSNNAVQGLKIGASQSYVELIYKNINKTANDTINLAMPNISFTHADFEPSGLMPSNFSNNSNFQLNDPEQMYFNGMLAIFPRLSINKYFDFTDSLDFMQVNKAELIIESDLLESSSTSTSAKLIPNLLFPYYIEGEDILTGGLSKEIFWGIQSNFSTSGSVVDQTGASSIVALTFDNNQSRISADISFFIQELFENPGFWNSEREIVLTSQFLPSNEIPFVRKPAFVMRSFRKFKLNKPSVKLKIYYTTLEE